LPSSHGGLKCYWRAQRQLSSAVEGRGPPRWAGRVDDGWLNQDLTWFSGAAGREISAPKRLLVTHFFNHQTHHRGQAHTLLTAAGQQTGDTDLYLVVPEMIA